MFDNWQKVKGRLVLLSGVYRAALRKGCPFCNVKHVHAARSTLVKPQCGRGTYRLEVDF